MEAMDSIPPRSLGTHSPRSWGPVPKRTCTCISSFPPAARWPSKSARECSTRARRQDSVPKRTSWARSRHTLTFFRCTKAASPPQATATPCSNTLREAITRTSLESNRLNAEPDAHRRHQSGRERPFHCASRRHHPPRHQAQQYSHQHAWHAHAFRFRHRGNDLRTPRHRLHHRVGSAGSACEERRRQRILRHLFSGGDAVRHADRPVAVRIRLFRSSWRNPRQRTRHPTRGTSFSPIRCPSSTVRMFLHKWSGSCARR